MVLFTSSLYVCPKGVPPKVMILLLIKASNNKLSPIDPATVRFSLCMTIEREDMLVACLWREASSELSELLLMNGYRVNQWKLSLFIYVMVKTDEFD